jgi:N-acetylneuraminate synthase
MKIADITLGPHSPPYIVAECSGNHCGLKSNAIRLIKAAKRCGANAVKTQCYDPEAMTLNMSKPDFIAQHGPWKGRSLYELYEKAQTPPAWHPDLYKAARDEGITIFSSVFDKRGVDLLASLDCPVYKIASFEIVDIPLIEYATSTGKPLIISTGMASDREIIEASNIAPQALFLHCISSYPTKTENARLNRMLKIQKEYGMVGLSDHTLGTEIQIAATAMGAVLIEKHLKLLYPDSGGDVSEDAEFSSTPSEFLKMVDAVKRIWLATQSTVDSDDESRQFRRSLYAVADIKEGECYTEENIRSIRPAYGLPPARMASLLGKPAKRAWRRGEPLS